MGQEHPLLKVSGSVCNQTIEVVNAYTSGPLVKSFLARQKPAPSFLGVSIRNKMSNKSHLRVLIPWLLARSEKTCIVIGDHIHRMNFMAFDGLSHSEANLKAFNAGKSVTKCLRSIISGLQINGTVEILSSAAITETPECQNLLRNILTYYHLNHPFSEHVEKELADFLYRVPSDRQPPKETYGLLKDYILEELAMFLYLYSAGFKIEVYPGPDLRLMQNVVLGSYSNFPFSCSERTHIAVRIQPKSQNLGEE